MPDDVTGASRQPIEVTLTRVEMKGQSFVQDKDHVEVFGQWKEGRYLEAWTIHNLTTGIVIKRAFWVPKVVGCLAIFVVVSLTASTLASSALGWGRINGPAVLIIVLMGLAFVILIARKAFKNPD